VRKKLILEISLAPAGEGVRLARRP